MPESTVTVPESDIKPEDVPVAKEAPTTEEVPVSAASTKDSSAAESETTVKQVNKVKTAAKASSPGKGAAAGKSQEQLFSKRQTQLIAAGETPLLKSVKPYIEKYSQQVTTAVVFFETTVLPILFKIYCVIRNLYIQAEPHFYGPAMSDLIPAICGLALCVFGGTFPLLIASVEAFRIVGYKQLMISARELWGEGRKALDAHAKDEVEDLDNDGIPDVQQICASELFTRKVLLLARSVDPEKVTTAGKAIATGSLAVLASLKLTFARAVTLGTTIGEMLKDQVDLRFSGHILAFVPDEYHKWVPVIIGFLTKSIAVSIAFTLQTIISAFHSAVRGGNIAASFGLQYLRRREMVSKDLDETFACKIGYLIAAVGFTFQLWMRFGIMFPFNILLFPVTLLEWSLSIAVTWF